MTTIDAELPVGLVCILHPGAVRVLQALGIDLGLEHARPLEEACGMRDLRVEAVLARIDEAERRGRGTDEDWEPLRAAAPRLPGLPGLGAPA